METTTYPNDVEIAKLVVRITTVEGELRKLQTNCADKKMELNELVQRHNDIADKMMEFNELVQLYDEYKDMIDARQAAELQENEKRRQQLLVELKELDARMTNVNLADTVHVPNVETVIMLANAYALDQGHY
jgi:DNA repair exonuclease SbcCD ATPase subunit